MVAKSPRRRAGNWVLAAVPAALCTAQAAESDASAEVVGLEEIVVTARQRAENIQHVPDSVTAFTAEAIERRGIRSIQDAVSFVPSVSFVNSQDAGLSNISIRGVGQVRNGEPPVAIVIDGVQLSSSDQIKQVLDDIERIEVLKGPQGALYGRNAIGGAIVIETRKPADHLTGQVQVGTGNGGAREVSAMVSGPIVPELAAFRLAGGYTDFDGLIENVTLNRKVDFQTSKYARGKLLLGSGTPWSVDLSGSWSKLSGGASYYIPVPDGDPNNTTVPVQAGQLGLSTRELKDLSAKVDFNVGGIDVRSVTAASSADVSLLESISWTPDTFIGATQERGAKSWSQELRFTSPTDRHIRWVGGLYYLDADHKTDTVLQLGPVPYQPLPVVRSTETSKAAAAFGQTNIDLNERLELTLALRYDQDKRTLVDRLSAAPDRSHTFDAWQPKVSLAYRLPDGPSWQDSMLYATVARGFRSGGFNAPSERFAPIYDSELTTSYEVGAKSTWFDGRLQANGAVFLTKYDNQQVFILAPNAVQGIVNVDKTRLNGAELELRAKATRRLELALAVSHIGSKIENFDGSSAYVGNKVPLTYGWSSNLSAQYTMLVGPATVSLWGGYERRTDNYWHIDNIARQAPVDLVNTRIGVEMDAWRVTLWARNLLDKAYTEEFFAKEYAGTANDIRYPGSPRTYGVNLLYRF